MRSALEFVSPVSIDLHQICSDEGLRLVTLLQNLSTVASSHYQHNWWNLIILVKKRLTVDGDAESFALQPCLEVRVHLPTVATTLARRDEKERCVRKLRSGNNGYQTLKRNWISFGVNDASVYRSDKNYASISSKIPPDIWTLEIISFKFPPPNTKLCSNAPRKCRIWSAIFL